MKLQLLIDPTLRIAADLHDLMYYFADGSDEQFSKANKAFAANGTILARHAYPWYDPRRYVVIFRAYRFAAICQKLGYLAYVNAINDRLAKK